MSESPDRLPSHVEARFKALASCVEPDTWNTLIAGTSDRILRRLAAVGAIAEPDPERLIAARQTIGEVLVEYTNVALTCVAEGESAGGAVAHDTPGGTY